MFRHWFCKPGLTHWRESSSFGSFFGTDPQFFRTLRLRISPTNFHLPCGTKKLKSWPDTFRRNQASWCCLLLWPSTSGHHRSMGTQDCILLSQFLHICTFRHQSPTFYEHSRNKLDPSCSLATGVLLGKSKLCTREDFAFFYCLLIIIWLFLIQVRKVRWKRQSFDQQVPYLRWPQG